jgi:hypothetical protein
VYTRNCIESSNLSFTATFYKHKPLIFLEKVGGLWFLASEKWPYGTDLGLEGGRLNLLVQDKGPICGHGRAITNQVLIWDG